MKYLYSFLLFVCLLTADRVLGQEEEDNAIFECAKEGYFFCVQALVEEFGVDINIRDRFGNTPIEYAVEGGHTDTVRMLLNKGADREVRGTASLLILHSYGVCRPEITSMLVSAGEDVNAANLGGATPLYISVSRAASDSIRDREERERCIQVVRILLDAGADEDQLSGDTRRRMVDLLLLEEGMYETL